MPLTKMPPNSPVPAPTTESRKVEAPLDQVFQAEPPLRPGPKLSLEMVVGRTIALSAGAVAVFMALALLALWFG